jgi:hypothetical protein
MFLFPIISEAQKRPRHTAVPLSLYDFPCHGQELGKGPPPFHEKDIWRKNVCGVWDFCPSGDFAEVKRSTRILLITF